MGHSNRRLLGIDYGSKRIGIAVSDPLNIIARGIRSIENTPSAIEEIREVCQEYEIGAIVIGMPFNLKGEKGTKAQEVETFVEKLRNDLGLDVTTMDERFTTTRVHQTLREMGVKKKERESKKQIDEMAAALILQSYLDRRKH